ncbi:MAG: sel1 repeat family protein [Xanthomonadales bacterium]|nr:sel1 repeat family protein [Xanthomonadaceae bacterium]MBN8225282.1 sel1 repeat family protein [Xanthomonadales bacterium]MCA0197206.1 sel1 repeat family protein [Pseudomonadota bacterium]HRF83598.1 sel1 repeat family protein [Pseudoxanthomonas sp.]
MSSKAFLVLLLLAVTPAAVAGGARTDKEPEIDPAVLTEGFLAAHPDLRWRAEGVRAYAEEDYAEAFEYLQRAARYADKAAQAMIAGMLWNGLGVAQDRPLAYAWMDLAAERYYHDFLVYREAYWNALSETERAAAIQRGQAILAEYGDDVAKPRLEKVLRQERRQVTGSRVGSVGPLTIVPFTGPMAGTGMTLRGDQYYADKYWEPKAYWRLQDEIWKAPLRERVDVGDVEQVDGAR